MIKLKVAEAIQDDVNRSVVRIGSKFMKTLKIKPGDFVELKGKRKTVAIADTAYHGDIGLDIIRMDGLIRKNADISIGELIKVKKINLVEAKKVIIGPGRKDVIIRIAQGVLSRFLVGRPVVKGDIVPLVEKKPRISDIPFFKDIFDNLDEAFVGFGDLKVRVLKTLPNKAVIVTNSTEILLKEGGFPTEAEEYIIKKANEYEVRIRSEKNIKKLMKLRREVKDLKVIVTKPVLKRLEKSKTKLLKLVDKKIKKLGKKK